MGSKLAAWQARKRLKGALSERFAPPKIHYKGPSNYFSDSFKRKLDFAEFIF